MQSTNYRALHWVFKIGNLRETLNFHEKYLALKVLRHEEFDSGCEASCNGPYQRPWSKTMIGYGPEDKNFALELTYNYGIKKYNKGNDLQYICVQADREELINNINKDLIVSQNEEFTMIKDPDNYLYKVIEVQKTRAENFIYVCLRVSNLENSKRFWVDLLNLKIFKEFQNEKEKGILVGFNEQDTLLQLVEFADGQQVDHADAFGRIAFACPSVPQIFEKIPKENIINEPITLKTEGKADVVVTILRDPDGYEICFVEDIGFYELAKPTYDVIDFQARAQKGGDK